MDFHDPPRERPPGVLDRRRRLRLVAITLWAGFLGAALTLLTAVALLPAAATHGAGWAEFSIGFLCAWLLAMVPAGLALLLAQPGGDREASRDGR